MSDHRLLSAKQIAPMLGYPPEQYKAVYGVLERAGIEQWRPDTPGSRMVRWYASDIETFVRNGGGATRRRTTQPEAKPTRFRKRAS